MVNKELLHWNSNVNIVEAFEIDYEFSGKTADDLMYVRGFATHEGINANGTKFRREILQKTYKSLLNKPLRILADMYNKPTGHGFNRKTNRFSKEVINIGHIIKVTPVIVGDDEQILAEVTSINSDLPQGNYRLMFDAVLYKEYYNEIAEVLINLHNSGELKFSIEANVSYELSEDGVKDCNDIRFVGLSIVRNPAFEKAFSILVAEEERKELDNLEFEQMYNEMKEKYDVVVAEKDTLIGEKAVLENTNKELSEKNQSLEADVIAKNTEIADFAVEMAELKTYKEKFEASEKEKLGNERLAKIKELGETELTATDLAEMNELDFSNTQVEMAKKFIDGASNLASMNFDTKLKKKNASDVLRNALFGE